VKNTNSLTLFFARTFTAVSVLTLLFVSVSPAQAGYVNSGGGFTTHINSNGTDTVGSLGGRWSVAALYTYLKNQYASADVQYRDTAIATYRSGEGLSYKSVKQIASKSLTTTGGVDERLNLDWITPKTANSKGETLNGFYAYKMTFDFDLTPFMTASGGWDTALLNTMSLFLDFKLGADDHLEGAYLNGISLMPDDYADSVGYGTEQWSVATAVSNEFYASEAIQSGLIQSSGNELVFIVHNDGHNGQASGFTNGSNATGMGAVGNIYIDAHKDLSNIATPEPATLLVFGLGIAGAAAARRR
jgi:hypothetical protein